MPEAEVIAKNKTILLKYIPAGAVDDVFEYLYSNKVHFKIVNNRKTKLGDYRWPQHQYRYHQITINGGLNAYAFLFVLLHEMAHHATYMIYRTTVQPHGQEWQRQYQTMLFNYVGKQVFPSDIELMIQKCYSSVPFKAMDERLMMDSFRRYDADYDSMPQTLLQDLPLNTLFRTENGRMFRSIEKRRTRYKCQSIPDGTLYLVQGTARVSIVNE